MKSVKKMNYMVNFKQNWVNLRANWKNSLGNFSYLFDIDAQERDQVHFGLKVGANYSNVYDISGVNLQNLTGKDNKGQDFTANYNQQVHAIEMSGIRQP